MNAWNTPKRTTYPDSRANELPVSACRREVGYSMRVFCRAIHVFAAAALGGAVAIGACGTSYGADDGVADAGAADAGTYGPGTDGSSTDAAAEGSTTSAGCSSRATYCKTPPCVSEVFTSTNAVNGLAVYGGWVYWTTDTAVFRKSTAGGATEMVAGSQIGAGPIVADPGGVFWLVRSAGKIFTCPLTGACPAPKLVATGPAVAGNEPIGMASDSEKVYWCAYGGPDGGVFGAVKTGDGGAVRFSNELGEKYVAVDDTTIYWQTNCAGAFSRKKDLTDAVGPLPTTCTTGQGGLALSQGALWIGGNELVRYPIRSGGVAALTLTPADGDRVSGLAVDCANDVYWTQQVDGGASLVRMPESAFLGGGAVDASTRETLATTPRTLSIVADSSGVYWAAGLEIRRLLRQP